VPQDIQKGHRSHGDVESRVIHDHPSPARRSKWEEFDGLVADLGGTYRAIWAVLAVVLGVAFVPAVLIRE
jgi:hypothetical protein